MHLVVLLALIFGLPHLKDPPLDLMQPIPIDITDLGPVTTTTQQAQGNQAKPQEIAPPPKPAQQQAKETPKEIPKPVPPTPPKPAEKPKPQEDKEAPTVADKPKKSTPPPKKPDKKPDPPKPDESKQFDSLLKNLTKTETPPAPDAVETKPTPTPASTGAAGVVSDKLTISEEDLLRRQIEQCWNVPVGGRDVGSMVVELKIEVNPDKTVKTVTVNDQARMGSDGFFRALAESAVRAVKNARCSPLQLPDGKYDMWKEINFRFDPKEMAGM